MWQFTKEKFSRYFGRLKVSKVFASETIKKHFVACREVFESDLQIDLSFNLGDCDDESNEIALKEAIKLGNDFAALEKYWHRKIT